MAIAFDAQSASAYESGTTLTFAHTCTGSDRILLVGVYTSSVDNVGSVTYNGVSCTFINRVTVTGTQDIYLYYLIAPATGSNNIVVTAAVGNLLGYAAATSYTGVKQSGQPDASATNQSASTTSLTTSVTTVADNCWLVGFGYGQTSTAGSGTVFRSEPVNDVLFMMDSNGAKTPAGSYGLTFTQSTNFAGACVASIAPAITTTIKTINGVTYANTKTFDNIAIANVKTINGVA